MLLREPLPWQSPFAVALPEKFIGKGRVGQRQRSVPESTANNNWPSPYWSILLSALDRFRTE
jgi:hypothetical protein